MKTIRPNTILILGSFAKGALEHQYVRGLKQNAWKVTWVDIQLNINDKRNKNITNKILFKLSPHFFYKAINEQVLDFAKLAKPQVILVFKGMELLPETIVQLKTYTKLLCNYNPDHPFKFYSEGAGNSNVLHSIKHFDLYFSYSQSICDQLIKNFNCQSYCIPFGFDETIKPLKREIPHITNQFLFIGAWDKEREQNLKALSGVNLNIFGPNNWASKLSELPQMNYHETSLYDQNYAEACLNAYGIINFLRPQNLIEQSHNMRTFEVPGYGGLLFSERTDEQLFFFEEDKEAIYFDRVEELNEKLIYYKKSPQKIQILKANALKRAISSGYSYSNRSEQLDGYLKKYL